MTRRHGQGRAFWHSNWLGRYWPLVQRTYPVGQSVPLNGGQSRLFDDLVGAQHDRWGYGKTKRLGGLEVHGHLELGRELHRELRADEQIE